MNTDINSQADCPHIRGCPLAFLSGDAHGLQEASELRRGQGSLEVPNAHLIVLLRLPESRDAGLCTYTWGARSCRPKLVVAHDVVEQVLQVVYLHEA